MEDHLTQLKPFIQQQLMNGISAEAITDQLKAASWPEHLIQIAMHEVRSDMHYAQPTAVAPLQPEQPSPIVEAQPAANVPDRPVEPLTVAEAGEQSYESNPFLVSLRGLTLIITRNPVSTLLMPLFIVLGAAGILALLLLNVVVAAHHLLPLLTTLAGLVLVLMIIGLAILHSAASHVIAAASLQSRTISVRETFGRAWQKLFPLMGLGIVRAIIIALGFVLLVVPGLIFMARLSLAPLAMFAEDLGPMAALQRSRQLTRGRAFEMFGAVIAGGLVAGASGLIAGAITLAPYAGRYHDLTLAEKTGIPLPKQHWLNVLLGLVMSVLIVALAVIADLTRHHV